MEECSIWEEAGKDQGFYYMIPFSPSAVGRYLDLHIVFVNQWFIFLFLFLLQYCTTFYKAGVIV